MPENSTKGEKMAYETITLLGPLVIERQGSFFVGGTVLRQAGAFDPFAFSSPGETHYGDHAYVQFQIPPDARKLPLVMWHGGGQMAKTWESTPDGREGFQTIFLRRGFAVYILDQPRRGRAGATTVGATVAPNFGDQSRFGIFRLGIWPDYFPNVQFPRDPESLKQFFRQQVPDTGTSDLGGNPAGREVMVSAAVALFEKIGPAVLITHSASGILGWLTAMRTPNVRAIVGYEPSPFVFPAGEMPPLPEFFKQSRHFPPSPVSPADFARLARIPIQVVYGDNIPTEPSPYAALESKRLAVAMAARFVEALRQYGGDATVLHLPERGLLGNTHFPFADLNNLAVADLLSEFLHEKALD
jgi:pimeloyl-ACP methyl ester carboxylesterase